MKPMAPVMKKTQRQLKLKTMAAIKGGARVAPMPDPALNMPNAIDLSFGGNHSEMAFEAAGKQPPSPIPSKKSPAPSPYTLETVPCITLAADHQIGRAS